MTTSTIILNDDVISEIVTWSPFDWLGITKRWRVMAIDAIYTVLRSRRNAGIEYPAKMFKMAARVDITRFIQFLNTNLSSANIWYAVSCLSRIEDENFIYSLISQRDKFDRDFYDKFVEVSVNEHIIDYPVACRLVDECGIRIGRLIDYIDTGIWNALYEHDGYMFSDEEWKSPDADIVLRYAIKYCPNYIREYIQRSHTYPGNWDAECITKILSYREVINMVTTEEYTMACLAAERERDYKSRNGSVYKFGPGTGGVGE